MERKMIAVKFQIHAFLDELRKLPELSEVKGGWVKRKVRVFQLHGALKEAACGLCQHREEYARAKLLDAKEIAHELGMGDIEERVSSSLASLFSPLIEEPTYTFEELIEILRKTGNAKFNRIISLLHKIPEKHELYFGLFSLPADEQRYYRGVFSTILSECDNIPACNQKEKDLLNKIKKRIEECVNVLNQNIKRKKPIFISSP
ncbi:MAG: hypothetical protein QXD51_01750 [Candidatus Anstonellales archaeon]